jgi:hypothetical protein
MRQGRGTETFDYFAVDIEVQAALVLTEMDAHAR